ncbi:hypothetical protein AB0J17_28665, partial [Streptomyces sp. NPDC049949]
PYAITTSNDRTARVWDLATGTHHTTLTGHTSTVNGVAVAQIDGRPHAITTSNDKTARVWDLTTGTHHTTLTGHTDWVTAVAVAQIDGRPHAITTGDDKTARVWDLYSVRCIAKLSLPLAGDAITAHKDCIVLGMANEVIVLQRNAQGS